jgi:nucleotide sugar dehydrogenase
MENITVVGIGKLGLGYALLLEKAGYNVLGVDISEEYVRTINQKTFRSAEPGYDELLCNATNLRATTSLRDGIEFSDTVFIIVQTPNGGGDRFYDHSILSNVLVKINALKPKNKDVVIGCTVMPNYIDQVGKHLLADCENTHLSYNPEFVAQGDIIQGFKNPDIILVGTTSPTLENKLRSIYGNFVQTTPKYCFLSPIEAETVKIGLNSYITTKIAFANMIGDFCYKVGADKYKVLDSIGSDSRIGNKYFRPGYSYGGPCFPRDTKAMQQLLKKNYIDYGILMATTASNESHALFQAKILSKNLNVSEYEFENVGYKENSRIPLIEESAKLKIAKQLVLWGKKVTIYDYADIIVEVKKEFGNMFTYRVKEDSESAPSVKGWTV